MKKSIFTILTACVLVIFIQQTFAQVPQGLNYQAVARNSAGTLVQNQSIALRLTLHQDSANGTPVYQERDTAKTNQFGLFTIIIGQGIQLSSDAFNTINWISGNYWLQTELDPTGGNSYTNMGTSQLLSVPYAMYAASVGSSGYIETDPIFIAHPSSGITANEISNWITAYGWGNHAGLYRPIAWVPAWTDVTGKPNFATVATSGSYNDLINKLTAGSGIQINGSNVISTNMTLSVSNANDTLHLNPGNYVIVPGISAVNSSQPHVTTSVITTITSISANCGYTVTMVGLPAITARGICYGTSPLPNIGGLHTTDGAGTGTFTGSMTGLTPNTIYYVRAYATNSNSTYYSLPDLMFTTPATLPTVTTDDTSSVGIATAACGGNVTDNGGANVTVRGVCYGTSQNPTISGTKTIDGAGNGGFTTAIPSLTANTLYFYRAYATNSAGTGYGMQKSFTTKSVLPSVFTDYVTSITAGTAVAQGHVTSEGTSAVTEKGLCYGRISNPPTIYDDKVVIGSGTGTINSLLDILTPNTPYYVRAYATNSIGTAYGTTLTFNTLNAFFEGFENGFPGYATGNWSITTDDKYEGYHSLRSNADGDSVSITRYISVPGQFIFNFKTQHSNITVDFSYTGHSPVNLNAGSWTSSSYSYPIPSAGNYTFKWKRLGNYYIGGGTWATCYLDYIICPN